MGMSSSFDDEVRRAAERREAEEKAERGRKENEEKARKAIADQKLEEERQLEEIEKLRDKAREEFKSNVATAIERLKAHGVPPSRVMVFPAARNSARAPEPPMKVGMFRRKAVPPPEPSPTQFRGWLMGISSKGNDTTRMAYRSAPRSYYHPDQTDWGESGDWVIDGKEEYFLCRDGNIYLLVTGDAGAASEARWHVQETVSVPPIMPGRRDSISGVLPKPDTGRISEWQQKWLENLATLFVRLTAP
jgi:hypothetical protein